MSKFIRITEEYAMECVKEFLAALQDMRMTDGKVSYTKILGTKDRRATLYFTPTAWTKMQLLVKNFDKEVAWHGIAERGEDPNADEYIISDILVYPQEVTTSTVETDQAEYEKWLCDLPDEVFNNLRMQGHSHATLGVSPSTVDTTHQGKILQQLDEDMFYIFLIWNKSNARWIKIYDFAKNTMFETSDVDVKIIGADFDSAAFMDEAKGLVKNRSYTTPSGSGYGYGSGYGTGNGGKLVSYAQQKPAETPAKSAEAEKKISEKSAESAGSASAESDDGWKDSGRVNRRNHYDGYGYDDYSYVDDDDERFWSGANYDRNIRDPFYARGY